MKNKNIAVGIMSSYRLLDSTNSCFDVWLKDFEYYFIFGGYKKTRGFIRLGRIGEDWNSAFLKQQLGLKYMFISNPKLDWYGIFGADNIVFENRVRDLLKSFDPSNKIFLGTKLKRLTIEDTTFTCLAGGGGFFISNALMEEIVSFIDDFNIIWYNLYKSRKIEFPFGASDVALSFMLKKYFNIDLYHVDGFYTDHPSKYNYTITNPLVLHYIRPNEMHYLYNKYL